MSSENLLYEAGRLETHGSEYQKLVPSILLQRLILEKCDFKLGFEVTDAGKFDDVVVCHNNEWHLIQVKHSQPKNGMVPKLTYDELFEENDSGGFSLLRYVKDFNKIKKKWTFGDIKHVILWTNRNLDPSFESNSYVKGEIHELFKFSKGKQYQIINQGEKMLDILKADAFKCDLKKIKKAMIKLFEKKEMDKILIDYNIYLKEILIEEDTVHLVERIIIDNSNLSTLHKELLKELQNKAVEKSAMGDFWKNTSNNIITETSRDTVDEFFSKFVLLVSQPNVEILKQVMVSESRRWMREWIRPDDFGKMNHSFCELPLSIIKTEFDDFGKPSTKKDDKESVKNFKEFLRQTHGKLIENKIIEKLNTEIQKIKNNSCANLESIGYYYINRKMTLSLTNPENEIVIYDSEFAKTILTNLDEYKFFVLTAQPGMGKSTLMQYLAFEVQKVSDNAVFLIYLNNLRSDLPTVGNMHDVSSKNIFQSELSSDNVEIIVNNNSTQIILFLDAFDELSEENRNKILQLINVLLKKKNIKVIVSGRRHVREALINKHNAFSMQVQAFNRDDKITFLRKFWKKSVDDADKFKKFVYHLLDIFDKGISNREQELVGIPLMLRMVAEIYEGLFEKYLSSTTDDLKQFIPEETITILSLYERFGTKSIQRSMNKNYNVNDNLKPGSLFNPLIKAIKYDYQVFAVECIIQGSYLFHFITDKKYHETIGSFKNRISNEQSLIVEIVSKRPQFTHLSFGEYFAAKYLFNFISEMERFVCKDEILDVFKSEENVCIFFLTIIDSIHDCSNNLSMSRINFQRLLLNLGNEFVFLSCAYNFPRIVKHLYSLHESFTFGMIRDADGKTVLEVAILKRAQKVCDVLIDIFKQNGALKNPLHFAVDSNCEELVQHYVDRQINVNAIDENECTALLRTKNDKILNVLLSAGANINALNQKGETLLHIASRKGKLETVSTLVEKKASIDLKSHDGKTPLDIACEEFHPNIVKFLLASLQAQNLDKQLNFEIQKLFTASLLQLFDYPMQVRSIENEFRNRLKNISQTNLLIGKDRSQDEINKVVHIAARLNVGEVIEKFLEKNADVNCQDKFGRTPLHFAAEFCSYENVKLFVDRFNDFSLTNNNQDTVLHCAARNSDSKCLELLIEKFKTLSLSLELTNNRYTPLEIAISERVETNVRLLVDAGANFIKLLDPKYPFSKHFPLNTMFAYFIETAINSSLQQPEHIIAAARVGCDKSVQLLINAGVDVNFADGSTRTALHYAAAYKHKKVVTLLVENGAEINIKDKDGCTPLHMVLKKYDTYAYNYNDEQTYNIYNTLVSAGANETSNDDDDNNVLHFASRAGCSELVKYIIDKEVVDLNLANKLGCTALHNAAKVGHEDIIDLLIRYGANVNVHDKEGKTPIHKAITRSKSEAVRCLLKHSPEVDLSQSKRLLQQNLNEERIRALLGMVKESRQTTLHALFETNNIDKDLTIFLIKAGVNVDAVDNKGNTVLHYASKEIGSHWYSYLIDLSTNINHKNKIGDTPLHIAIKHSYNSDYLRILITKNACIQLADKEGNTPLHLLILKYNETDPYKDDFKRTIFFLIKHSPELNRQNKKGETVLHLAVYVNDYPMVEKLVEKGTDLTLKTIEGKTALGVAKDEQYQKNYEFLLETERKPISESDEE